MLPLKNYRVFKNSLVLSDLTFIVSDFFFFSKYNKNYLALASYLNLTLADFFFESPSRRTSLFYWMGEVVGTEPPSHPARGCLLR